MNPFALTVCWQRKRKAARSAFGVARGVFISPFCNKHQVHVSLFSASPLPVWGFLQEVSPQKVEAARGRCLQKEEPGRDAFADRCRSQKRPRSRRRRRYFKNQVRMMLSKIRNKMRCCAGRFGDRARRFALSFFCRIYCRAHDAASPFPVPRTLRSEMDVSLLSPAAPFDPVRHVYKQDPVEGSTDGGNCQGLLHPQTEN